MATGSTVNYSVPYPLSTDPVNVAGDIEQLSDFLDDFFTNPVYINDIRIDGGDIRTTSNTVTIFNSNATTASIFGAGTNITMGATTGTATIRNANTVLSGDLAVNGGDLTTSQTTFNLVNSNATTVNFAGAATTITMGVISSGTTTIQSANTVVSGDLAVNGDDLTTTTNTTFNLINANTTSINFGGDASTINIGASSSQVNFAGDANAATNYKIANTVVMNATALGTGIVNSNLTSVGTLTTGVWRATEIAPDKGGTGQTSYTSGDMIYATGSNAISKLSIGTSNYVLTSNGSSPVWTQNTGTGNVVRATSPSLTTPNIGAATGTSLATTGQITASNTTGKVILGVDGGGSVSLGRTDNTSSTPYIDFNSGSTTVDYDARIQVANGTGTQGGGDVTVTSANIYSTGNILPSTDNTGVVGNSSYTWSNGQFTNMTIDSTLNVRAAIDLADSDILRFGTSDDVQMFYDGSLNVFDIELEAAAVSLNITDNGTDKIIFTKSSGNISTAGNELKVLYGQASGSSDFNLSVERGSDPDVSIKWNETGNAWQFTNDGTTYYDIPTSAGGGGATGFESSLFLGGM